MPTDLRYTSLLASPVAFRSPVLLILPTGHRCCQSIASRAEHDDKCAGAARVMLTRIRADQARQFAPSKLSGPMPASLRRWYRRGKKKPRLQLCLNTAGTFKVWDKGTPFEGPMQVA